MQYRQDKHDENVSILGFGCMRFERKGGQIDLAEAEREILHAIDLGVNYFDTAYVYPGSEAAVGEILARNNVRDRVNIATKLPQYLVKKADAIDRYFNEELRRLQTDHVDFYLMHMMTDYAQWENLHRLGIESWIARKKAAGQIRNIGFSFHGNTDTFLRILDTYDWDFCQIQYNYLDEHTQAGRVGLEAAAARGIPVIIMEPLRGGKLVNMLPPDAREAIAHSPRSWTAAEWGLRWLWNQPGVTCVLSGMNSMDMVDENCRIASDALPNSFTTEDNATIERLRQAINARVKIGCTGCRYCMPCPQGVDIPGIFRCYNEMFTENKATGRHEFFQTIALRREPGLATQCIKCGKCERVCPQSLPIRDALVEADRALRPPTYKIAIAVSRKFMFR